MNHDALHCEDYRKTYCPKWCEYAKLTKDLRDRKARDELIGIPMSFAHLLGTDECPRQSKEG